MKSNTNRLSSLHTQITTTLRDATFRVCAALELINSAKATQLRSELHERLNAAHQLVQEGAAINARVQQTVHTRNTTDSTFMKGLRGFVALAQVADPELAQKLPPIANLSRLDVDGYARLLAETLRRGDKRARAMADFIESAIENRLAAARSALEAKSSQAQLANSRRATKGVKALLHTAEAFVHDSVESDSPLLQMLKAPRKPKKPKQPAAPKAEVAAAPVVVAPAPAPEAPAPNEKPASVAAA